MNQTTPTIEQLVSVIREYNVALDIRSRTIYATACEEPEEPDDGFEYLRESAYLASNFLQATLRSYELTKAPNEKS